MDTEGSDALISMIVTTMGRDKELARLLDSLLNQNDLNIEIIIVDQNSDERLAPIVAAFESKLPLQRIKTSIRGATRGRNLGVSHSKGEWLFFPDDDSWYDPDFVARLRGFIRTEPADIYSGRAVDANGKEIMVPVLPEDAEITRENVWNVMIEWTVALRAETFCAAGGFDEHVGVGAGTIWASGEIQDLVLRCLENGARGLYRRALYGRHPELDLTLSDEAQIRKMYGYSVGYGFIMHRHGFGWPRMIMPILRPLAGTLLYALTGRASRAKRSLHILQGRIAGWRSWKGQPVVSENLRPASKESLA